MFSDDLLDAIKNYAEKLNSGYILLFKQDENDSLLAFSMVDRNGNAILDKNGTPVIYGMSDLGALLAKFGGVFSKKQQAALVPSEQVREKLDKYRQMAIGKGSLSYKRFLNTSDLKPKPAQQNFSEVRFNRKMNMAGGRQGR